MIFYLIFSICFLGNSTTSIQTYSKKDDDIKNENSTLPSPTYYYNTDYHIITINFYPPYTEIKLKPSEYVTVLNKNIEQYCFHLLREGEVRFNFKYYNTNIDHESIKRFMRTLVFHHKMQIVFYVLTKDYDISEFSYMAKSIDTYVESINESNDIYILADYHCIWSDEDNHYFWEGKYHRWREICISGESYYHYCTEEKVQIKYFNLSSFVVIIVVVILAIIAIITSLYLIGYFKYKKIKEAENSSFSSSDENE